MGFLEYFMDNFVKSGELPNRIFLQRVVPGADAAHDTVGLPRDHGEGTAGHLNVLPDD